LAIMLDIMAFSLIQSINHYLYTVLHITKISMEQKGVKIGRWNNISQLSNNLRSKLRDSVFYTVVGFSYPSVEMHVVFLTFLS